MLVQAIHATMAICGWPVKHRKSNPNSKNGKKHEKGLRRIKYKQKEPEIKKGCGSYQLIPENKVDIRDKFKSH